MECASELLSEGDSAALLRGLTGSFGRECPLADTKGESVQ